MSTIVVICSNCDQSFLKQKRFIKDGLSHFCSRSCSATFNNKKFPKRIRIKATNNFCKECGTEVTLKNRSFCSKTCYEKHRNDKVYNKFLVGKVTNSRVIKRILSIYYNQNSCALCEQGSEWKGKPLVLQLDHIDGNSDNNFPENLRVLCPNCHTQTDTYSNKKKLIKDTKRNRKLRNTRSKL